MWKRIINNVWVKIAAGIVVAGVLFVVIWSIEYSRPIPKEKLPASAQKFIADYYADHSVLMIQKEMNELSISYEVVFTGGTKLEFRRNGTWREVDCGAGELIPEVILPSQIATHLQENFPGSYVTRIEHDDRRYEVELNDHREVTFDDRTFWVTDYDD